MHAIPDHAVLDIRPEVALSWLMPLHFFYERRNLDLPPLQFIDGSAMPEPDQELLVHERDMTPTLAKYHNSDLSLEVLDKECSGDYLLRIVILRRRDNLMPVECGAIGIHLNMFEPGHRNLIEDGRVPLGGVLEQESIAHQGSPRGFFQVCADEIIAHALGEEVDQRLYGRCNELSFPDGYAFADIVEILPSTPSPSAGGQA